jgi:hypothetical protein
VLAIENKRLRAIISAGDALAAKYEEAIGDLSDWGAYVSEYFQVKHGFTKCVTDHVGWVAGRLPRSQGRRYRRGEVTDTMKEIERLVDEFQWAVNSYDESPDKYTLPVQNESRTALLDAIRRVVEQRDSAVKDEELFRKACCLSTKAMSDAFNESNAAYNSRVDAALAAIGELPKEQGT